MSDSMRKGIIAYCDGACCHQTGLIGIGGLLYDNEQPESVITEFSIPAGMGDSYTAELKALWTLLLYLKSYCPSNIEIYMDNSSIVLSLNAFLYKRRTLHGPLLQTALQLKKLMDDGNKVRLNHIRRFQNKAADRLSKRALNQARYALSTKEKPR